MKHKIHWRYGGQGTVRAWTDNMSKYGAFTVFPTTEFEKFRDTVTSNDLEIELEFHDIDED